MRIHLTSVFVDDQAKALHFYTEILGFAKKHDVPLGEKDRWLTVVSPEEPDGTELLHGARRAPGCGDVPRRVGRGRHPARPVRRRGREGGVRAPQRARRPLHPGAPGDGPRDDRGLRRHLRQLDPDRLAVAAPAPRGAGHRPAAAGGRARGPGTSRSGRGPRPRTARHNPLRLHALGGTSTSGSIIPRAAGNRSAAPDRGDHGEQRTAQRRGQRRDPRPAAGAKNFAETFLGGGTSYEMRRLDFRVFGVAVGAPRRRARSRKLCATSSVPSRTSPTSTAPPSSSASSDGTGPAGRVTGRRRG